MKRERERGQVSTIPPFFSTQSERRFESVKTVDGGDLTPFRRKTRVVMVGSVGVGGDNPIRLQSMTTTPTMDTEATVNQVKRLADVGCEIARITAPTVNEARNLEHIKSSLVQSGYSIPLVADIHFRPDAAMVSADFVEKVRVNPGNFVDGKPSKFEIHRRRISR